MPNSPSAKKRLRQNEKRRLRNRAVKSSLRTHVRKVREAASGGQVDVAATELVAAARKLDQAAAKGIIHPNKAARSKSRLNRLIKSLKAPANA